MRCSLQFLLAFWGSCLPLVTCQAATPSTDAPFSHKQARVFKPVLKESPNATLWSFTTTPSGELWLSVSATRRHEVGSSSAAGGTIQVLNPHGDLLREFPLPMAASAMSLAPDGTLFVAGQGKMAHLSAEGKVLAEGPFPNVGDAADYRERIVEGLKDQYKQMQKYSKELTESLDKQIAEATKKLEDNPGDEAQAALDQLKTTREQYANMYGSENPTDAQIEAAMRGNSTSPGLAATASQVFIVVRSPNKRSYEVWRTNYEFKEGAMVKDDLSGCCGNFDIQPRDEGFVACENCRFSVATYTSDGKLVSEFGSRDRNAPEGFGSCCNPMNSISLANGDYVVAESSIGHIKRFDSHGKYLATIGKAKIGGGCKHVSLGYDAKLDHYYMLHEDKNHICVLVPVSEAPEQTPEEQAAREAKAGLGQKLLGKWEAPDAPLLITGDSQPTFLEGLLGPKKTRKQVHPTAEFLPSGDVKFFGSQLAMFSGQMTWECVEQHDKVLTFDLYSDGVQYFTIEATFADDDHFRLNSSNEPNPTEYRRCAVDGSAPPPEQKAQNAAKPVQVDGVITSIEPAQP